MMSLTGIALGLIIFVFLAFRGFNLLLSAVAGSSLMFLFSGIGVLEGLNEIYLPGLSEFLKNYFLLFFLSALLGKLMSDGGNARKIALALSSLIRRSGRNQQFYCALLAPALYFIMCYVGISGFIVIFTVLPIARTIYEETDTPWRMYCCAGAQSVSAAYLAGSIQAGNVYAADVCGTTTMAGWKLSLIAVGVFLAVSVAVIRWLLTKARARGEGFLPSGRGIRETVMNGEIADDRLPGLLPGLLPIMAVLVMSAVFHVQVVKALFAGCLLAVITGRRNLFPHIRESLTQGITSAYGPILSVSATYAIGAVIVRLEGFSYFQEMLGTLPPLIGASVLGLLSAFIMASIAAPIPAFGGHMMEQYLLAGLTAENAHRMMMITTCTSIAPHNAGISNAASVLRMPYRECLKIYMLSTYIPGTAALLVSMACVSMGIV